MEGDVGGDGVAYEIVGWRGNKKVEDCTVGWYETFGVANDGCWLLYHTQDTTHNERGKQVLSLKKPYCRADLPYLLALPPHPS